MNSIRESEQHKGTDNAGRATLKTLTTTGGACDEVILRIDGEPKEKQGNQDRADPEYSNLLSRSRRRNATSRERARCRKLLSAGRYLWEPDVSASTCVPRPNIRKQSRTPTMDRVRGSRSSGIPDGHGSTEVCGTHISLRPSRWHWTSPRDLARAMPAVKWLTGRQRWNWPEPARPVVGPGTAPFVRPSSTSDGTPVPWLAAAPHNDRCQHRGNAQNGGGLCPRTEGTGSALRAGARVRGRNDPRNSHPGESDPGKRLRPAPRDDNEQRHQQNERTADNEDDDGGHCN